MTLQHLARDLGIAWLVGADKADNLQAGKKKKPAKRYERQQFGGAAGAVVRAT